MSDQVSQLLKQAVDVSNQISELEEDRDSLIARANKLIKDQKSTSIAPALNFDTSTVAIGDWVRCIRSSSNSLTVGRVYAVLDIASKTNLVIANNAGNILRAHVNNFELDS